MSLQNIKPAVQKILLISFVIIFSAACFRSEYTEIENIDNYSSVDFKPVAVIELFTSQGCSSCPSADALLRKTIQQAEKDGSNIFALSYHVDYWNRLGWKDPFSSSAFSERQNKYVSRMQLNSAYTPQMIVNGNREFVGSDSRRLQGALQSALTQNASVRFITLSVEKNSSTLKVIYTIEGNIKSSMINFALVSSTETTEIKRGENSGKTLVNENVVISLSAKDADKQGQIEIPVIKENGQQAIIAFIQNKNNLEITGAAKVFLK